MQCKHPLQMLTQHMNLNYLKMQTFLSELTQLFLYLGHSILICDSHQEKKIVTSNISLKFSVSRNVNTNGCSPNSTLAWKDMQFKTRDQPKWKKWVEHWEDRAGSSITSVTLVVTLCTMFFTGFLQQRNQGLLQFREDRIFKGRLWGHSADVKD